MATRELTQDEFMKDVQSHSMTVVRDDGVFRHLTFRQPEHSWLHWFDVVTWPGALCYDLGYEDAKGKRDVLIANADVEAWRAFCGANI